MKLIDVLFIVLVIPIIIFIYPQEEYGINIEDDNTFSYNFTFENREEFEYKLLKEIYIYKLQGFLLLFAGK